MSNPFAIYCEPNEYGSWNTTLIRYAEGKYLIPDYQDHVAAYTQAGKVHDSVASLLETNDSEVARIAEHRDRHLVEAYREYHEKHRGYTSDGWTHNPQQIAEGVNPTHLKHVKQFWEEVLKFRQAHVRIMGSDSVPDLSPDNMSTDDLVRWVKIRDDIKEAVK